MELNFIDLKDIADSRQHSAQHANCEKNKPELTRLVETPSNLRAILNYAIKKIFNIHTQVSQTVWDINMFNDELKREGSGFIACYADYNEKSNNTAKGHFIRNTGITMKLGLKSKIIGFFIFYTVLDEMHILDIAVAKDVQSNGIGTLMLDHVLKKYISLGVKYFYLEARVSNTAAINLYKKFGFKIFMLRKDYYDDNKEDALCMMKEIA